MLSRVAENLYWMTRYVERAENTARLINVNSHLLLDLPRHINPGWEPLIAITGSEESFAELYDEMDERNVVRFLVGDARNPASIIGSLDLARENLRTTRDIVPREAWELINDLHLFARKRTATGVAKQKRYEVLNHIIGQCQQLAGLLAGTMSHDTGYDFIRLGRNLERGDMTTRILDTRSEDLLPKHAEDLTPFESIQWMSVLKSLTAYQMYRRHVRVRVRGADVLKFLLQDYAFPRSLTHCLIQVESCLRNLPFNEQPLRTATRLQRIVHEADVIALVGAGLHRFIDDIQVELANMHIHIQSAYFEVSHAA